MQVDLQCLWLEHIDLGSDPISVNAAPPRAAPLMVVATVVKPQVLKRVVLASNAMTKLIWRACPSLEQAILACPYLREAHFDSCDLLRDDVLCTLGDGTLPPALPARYANMPLRGGCPRLRCVPSSSDLWGPMRNIHDASTLWAAVRLPSFNRQEDASIVGNKKMQTLNKGS